jgi:hypothetical protein
MQVGVGVRVGVRTGAELGEGEEEVGEKGRRGGRAAEKLRVDQEAREEGVEVAGLKNF